MTRDGCWRRWKHGMIDLNPSYLKTVKGILAEHVRESEVRAFGSRATWTAKDYSDLDLAIVGVSALDCGTLSQLKEAFEQSDLPMRVDILDWHTITDSFRKVIEQDYVVVQRGSASICFGDVADIVMGQSPPSGTVSGEQGLALLNGPTEFGTHHPTPVQFTTDARKYAKQGDLLFCVRGSTTGRMNWADQHYAIGRGVAAIRHRQETTLQPFIRAVIEFELSELLAQATGSTFPNVSARQLAEIPYPSFDKNEQRAIAHILGTLDDKIELNRGMNETLEAMARALFKDWFVDFGPVRAKMEGRDTGLPKRLADFFPDRLVDSELGEIPEGWEVGALGNVLRQRVERCHASEETASLPYVPIDCISPRSLFLTESKPGEEAKSSLTKFYTGDLIFGAMRPYYHKVCIAPFYGTTRTTAFILYPKRKHDFAFATLLLHDPDTIDFATRNSTGSTIPYAVWVDSLEAMATIIPTSGVLKAFNDTVRPFLMRIPQSYYESRTLSAMRDTLLPKLISGELRVKFAERLIGEAKSL